MPNRAIFPGSFDPPTNGHIDIITRASRLAGSLVVAVLNNTSKQPLFPVEERIEMLREATAQFPNVEVDAFNGLLVDYAAQRSADAIIRGIRALSDYEMELQMALMNRRLRPDTSTGLLSYWATAQEIKITPHVCLLDVVEIQLAVASAVGGSGW